MRGNDAHRETAMALKVELKPGGKPSQLLALSQTH
jgi:hypothetical protein